MNGQELICLSSSDDEKPPAKKKRIQPTLVKKAKPCPKSKKKPSINEPIICLDSDDDNDSQEVSKVNNVKENGEANGVTSPVVCEEKKEKIIENGKQKVVEQDANSETENEEEKSATPSIANSCQNKPDDVKEEEPKETVLPLVEKDVASTSGKNDNLLHNTDGLPIEAISFLTTVKTQLEGTSSAEQIFKKFPSLIKMFKELADVISKTDFLKKFLKSQTEIANKSVRGCIISFTDVYQQLKASLECDGVELSKKHWHHVRKLEDVMKKILKKLQEFNESEVDFDADESESPYIKHERYSQRLCVVYKKYCEILKRNPYAGRITHERLDFMNSRYNEFNLAISKKYKNNGVFPSYNELATYLKKVNEEQNLNLSSSALKVESEHCFKKLGDLLQSRRKKELYEAHCSYVPDAEDPAEKDKELDAKLRISSKERKVKIEEICEEFVKKQEMGVNQEEFDCSDTNDDEEEEEDAQEEKATEIQEDTSDSE